MARRAPAARPVMDLAIGLASLTNRWGADLLPDDCDEALHTAEGVYRIGGNSCLSGDFMGYWHFHRTLQPGDEVVFEDMIHYTTVKTTMFNGIHHPDLRLEHTDGSVELLRRYTYEDYRDRMD